MKAYLLSTSTGTSSPRNPKLGSVRIVMNDYIRALRESGNSSVRVTLHGIHIYVNGQPATLSEIKERTRELNRRATQAESFRCPKCSFVSFNPNDIEHRYCGRCHEYSP